MAEIAAFAAEYRMGLFVPELAAREWIAHCTEEAIRTMRRVVGDSKRLGETLGRDPPAVDVIDDKEICETVLAVQKQRLARAGFELVPTPAINLAELIDVFLVKKPPFGDGDRGFKDAVILETVFGHACTSNMFTDIVLVTGDKRFQHASIIERFSQAGTTLHCVDGPPQDLLRQTVDKLNGMMEKASGAAFHGMLETATAFAQQHQEEILDFVMKNAKMGLSDIKGYGRAARLKKESDADAKLKYARILSIDAIRPREVISAFPWWSPLHERTDGRQGILVTVDIEIDLTIASSNLFAEPRVPLADPSSLLEQQVAWDRPVTEETITVVRALSVRGSVSPEGFPHKLEDLRLEDAY
jgi:hypothetical protein